MAALRARGAAPSDILEPTCGGGAFLQAAAAAFPAARRLIGIEYQAERYRSALAELQRADPRIVIRYDDAYTFDFAELLGHASGQLAIVGNPPWVTTAALGTVAGPVVQPPRTNPKRLSGLAARTGAANFDVAEYLILALLAQLQGRPLQLALLVKESVARNVLDATAGLELSIVSAEIVRIDARRWFGVSVDACALLMTTGTSELRRPVHIRADFGAAPCAEYLPSDGRSTSSLPRRWRQGIKHDAASVFELVQKNGTWQNDGGEIVDVEGAYIYPLAKARELHSGREPGHGLIVPQRRLGEPTANLATSAPRLHAYLSAHAARLAARKSSIYRAAPPFAIFGIGTYSFAPWKVAVAGFYGEPRFRLLEPLAGRPVMLGDTAYFVPFDDERAARAFLLRCEAPENRTALGARIVRGKRPITKRLLDAIDWDAANEPSS